MEKELTATLDDTRAEALFALLDDPSPTVQQALAAEIMRYGEEAWALLRRAERSASTERSKAAAKLMDSMGLQNPSATFQRFIRSFQYELETGSLLLERTEDPTLEGNAYTDLLDAMAARVRELTMLPCTPMERCRTLNRVFFHEYGFRGDVEDYYNPANSFLSTVLRRRKGIPISLSILYLLVAERSGFELEPIGLPYRFMVGCFLQRQPFFIDPFEHGTIRSPEEVMHFLRKHGVSPRTEMLMPTPIGEVLCRCCRNLARQYKSIGQEESARTYQEFVEEFEHAYERHARSH